MGKHDMETADAGRRISVVINTYNAAKHLIA